MTSKPRKVLIFGLDGPVAPALLKYCREGKLPAMARLIDTGVLAPNAMVPLPTATPANWASIGTGSWPGLSCTGAAATPVYLSSWPKRTSRATIS